MAQSPPLEPMLPPSSSSSSSSSSSLPLSSSSSLINSFADGLQSGGDAAIPGVVAQPLFGTVQNLGRLTCTMTKCSQTKLKPLLAVPPSPSHRSNCTRTSGAKRRACNTVTHVPAPKVKLSKSPCRHHLSFLCLLRVCVRRCRRSGLPILLRLYLAPFPSLFTLWAML